MKYLDTWISAERENDKIFRAFIWVKVAAREHGSYDLLHVSTKLGLKENGTALSQAILPDGPRTTSLGIPVTCTK